MDFICIELANTRWSISHKPFSDPLKDIHWIKDFLHRWDFSIDSDISEEQVKQLDDLRGLIVRVLEEFGRNGEIQQPCIDNLNHYLQRSNLTYIFSKDDSTYRISLKPIENNWNYVLSKITTSLIELIANGTIKQMKRCENPDCRWIFHDESKNNSRKWCCNTCASLIKVRKFRQRRELNEKTDT
ncbi:MAG: CGNR zinc finger domain-containing protein [Clostridia bacterium]|nr:CGNR zinc finger domain-containing protein [Clostridia bacterium]